MTEIEFLEQARWLADRRGYKQSWCYAIFRQKYGKWPGKRFKDAKNLTPPSDEFWGCLVEQWGVDAVHGIQDWLRVMYKNGTGNEPNIR